MLQVGRQQKIDNDCIKLWVGVLILAGFVIGYVVFRIHQKKKLNRRIAERRSLTSIIDDDDDLERGAQQRRFTYPEIVLATNNFSRDRKLCDGGFGAVYRGYFV